MRAGDSGRRMGAVHKRRSELRSLAVETLGVGCLVAAAAVSFGVGAALACAGLWLVVVANVTGEGP